MEDNEFSSFENMLIIKVLFIKWRHGIWRRRSPFGSGIMGLDGRLKQYTVELSGIANVCSGTQWQIGSYDCNCEMLRFTVDTTFFQRPLIIHWTSPLFTTHHSNFYSTSTQHPYNVDSTYNQRLFNVLSTFIQRLFNVHSTYI